MKNYMPQAKDPYKILGVDRDATHDQIHAAYVRLARKYHPDMHPPGATYAEEMFKEVASAYQVLSDDALRTRYDQGPATTVRPQPVRQPVDIDPDILRLLQRPPARDRFGRQFIFSHDVQFTDVTLRVALLVLGLGLALQIAMYNVFAGFVLLGVTISLSAGWLAASLAGYYHKNAVLWFAIVTGLVIIVFAAMALLVASHLIWPVRSFSGF